MRTRQLPNYLRSNRKRLGLSQGDVALLLGQKGSAHVSHYESFNRIPSLKTALAYEAIYKIPVSEIFAGLYEKAEREVAERAKALRSKIDKRADSAKDKVLASLAEISS